MRSKPGILSIDIGGSGLKADVLDDRGHTLADRVRVPTPQPCPPAVLLDTVATMVAGLPAFDRISAGFPGFIKAGKVITAPNLGPADWAGFALEKALSRKLGGHPAKLINDAEMQGLALISGKGLELVVTLGTGMGSGLFRDGELMPHMELAHHPLRRKKTYEDRVGNAALKKVGKKRWNKHVRQALDALNTLLNPDRIFIGGGNAEHLSTEALPANVVIGTNAAGIVGGAALWR
jgi:polyphosphate glucokinase